MSGTLDLIQRGYLGRRVRDGILYFEPWLTGRLDGLRLRSRYPGSA